MKKICFFLVALLFTLSAGAQTNNCDVNGDGEINVVDVTAVVKVILNGGNSQIYDCDINGDNDVNVVDVTAVVKAILNGGNNSVTPTTGKAIDLGLSVKWASCNVGATKPEEYGGYYAWGETEEKSDYSWSTYKYCNGTSTSMTKYCTYSDHGTVDNKTTLEAEDDVAHVKWGGSWRMPTFVEMEELRTNCTWNETTINGVNGYRVTGPNGNSIFLPKAGSYTVSGLSSLGTIGSYWASSLFTYYNSNNAEGLSFNSNDGWWLCEYRNSGLSVRPVCE